jgi:hypothetical protein
MADAGVETFVLFTESGLETLRGYWTDRGKPIPDNIHWHVLPQPEGSFASLEKSAELIASSTQDALYKVQDFNRSKNNQFVGMLRALANFPDDRTGARFGAVDSWGPSRCLAIDSLSGINTFAFSLVVGNKPIKSQTDWGLAQGEIEKLIRTCTQCKCHFILTAHVERETDMVFGGVKVTVSVPGKALAPKIPPFFSDVILTERNGTKFSWSTANVLADLKARNVPIADNITPSFGQIIEKWKSRGGKL